MVSAMIFVKNIFFPLSFPFSFKNLCSLFFLTINLIKTSVGPLLKEMPKNFVKRVTTNFPDYIIWALPIGLVAWADGEYEKDYRATWD